MMRRFFIIYLLIASLLPTVQAALPVIPRDSLQRLGGETLPLYQFRGRLYLAVPRGELLLTAQADAGCGIRNRLLPTPGLFSLERTDSVWQVRGQDTILGFKPLPAAVVAETGAPLADLTEALLKPGLWLEMPLSRLRRSTILPDRLLEVATLERGVLLRLRRYYSIQREQPAVEMLVPDAAVPLDLSVAITLAATARPEPRLVVGASVPSEHEALLVRAVEAYNREHGATSVHLEGGMELVGAQTPYAVSYDAVKETQSLTLGPRTKAGDVLSARINFGIKECSEEALRSCLRQAVSRGRINKLLGDAAKRRESYYISALQAALRSVFGTSADTLATPEGMKREFRDARRCTKVWAHLARKFDSDDGDVSGARYEAACRDEAQRLYLGLVRRSKGMPLQCQIVEWVCEQLSEDVAGRFVPLFLHRNRLQPAWWVTDHYCREVWSGVLAVADVESLARLPRLFREQLSGAARDSWMNSQSCCVAVLENYPEQRAFAAQLRVMYSDLLSNEEVPLATFARMQLERLPTGREAKK